MPLKRFPFFHGEELSEKHPAIFKTICQELVVKLKVNLDDPVSQELLIDLVGQPSLLAPVVFVRGFLYTAKDTSRANFIKYGYKEAIEEGLKEKYDEGGRKLWAVMVNILPNQFSGEYPSTDEARSIALKDFKPTKQDREEQWIVSNAQNHQTRFRMGHLAKYLDKLDIDTLTVLWVIVAEYATVPTWLGIE